MTSDVGRNILSGLRDTAREVIWERADAEVFRIKKMDIARAAAALLDANVGEKTIERFLCKYWNLRPSKAHEFIREGEGERKI